MNVGFGVISIAVAFESMLMDYVQDINSVQKEQQWIQNRTLWYTAV